MVSTTMVWADVPVGASVRMRDGYVWIVAEVRASGEVVVGRDGRLPFIGRPGPLDTVDVVAMPDTPHATRDAATTLRSAMSIELIECGWCAQSSDPLAALDSDCVCEAWCGTAWCINFKTALAR